MRKILCLYFLLACLSAQAFELKIVNASSYDKVVVNGSTYVRSELMCEVPSDPSPFEVRVQGLTSSNTLNDIALLNIDGNCQLICQDNGATIKTSDNMGWFIKGVAFSILINGFSLFARLVRRGIFGNCNPSME